MAQRPRGSERMADGEFSEAPPADAADAIPVAEPGCGLAAPLNDTIILPGTVQAALAQAPTGPALSGQRDGPGDMLMGHGSIVKQTEMGPAVLSGTGLAEAAAGNPHLAIPGPRQQSIITPPRREGIVKTATQATDEDLAPESFKCSRLFLDVPITRGSSSYREGATEVMGLDPDLLVVKNGICTTPSVEQLWGKYWAYCQSMGISEERLNAETRSRVASVILRAKDMCRNTATYGISASFTPLPNAPDPGAARRAQVEAWAKEDGLSPAAFIANLGAPAPAQGDLNKPRILREQTPNDIHRGIIENQGRQPAQALNP